ncbi:ATPase family AAA domain-containing protein 3 [Aspergillus awamori]|uniref:ATPase family AAA domain-containing protein 3 n=1 Tax=Aspergillus awamori TaxID=105351 RepID=A0A401L7C8_ASPAW|nr:ATPase family AAA domain-containing protein 3 [Aspergillus awamori]
MYTSPRAAQSTSHSPAGQLRSNILAGSSRTPPSRLARQSHAPQNTLYVHPSLERHLGIISHSPQKPPSEIQAEEEEKNLGANEEIEAPDNPYLAQNAVSEVEGHYLESEEVGNEEQGEQKKGKRRVVKSKRPSKENIDNTSREGQSFDLQEIITPSLLHLNPETREDPESLAEQISKKLSNFQYLKNATISEDQTDTTDNKKKKLSVLQGISKRSQNAQVKAATEPDKRIDSYSSHAIEDHKMHIMLLEQQNKRRLMLQRQEEDREQEETMHSKLGNVGQHIEEQDQSPDNYDTGTRLSNTARGNPSNSHHGTMSKDEGSEMPPVSQKYSQLFDYAKTLEQENLFLKTLIDPDSVYQGRPFFQVLHRMRGGGKIFFSPPTWKQGVVDGELRYTLQEPSLSMKADEYLKRSTNLAFVIYKTYDDKVGNDSHLHCNNHDVTLSVPDPDTETVSFVSWKMVRAMERFLHIQPGYRRLFPDPISRAEIEAPYLFWYCYRSSFGAVQNSLSTADKRLVQLFEEWATPNYQEEYARVEDQMRRGVISRLSLKYLVRPGTILVSNNKGHPQAYMATTWATQNADNDKTWNVSGWAYEFDGVFYRRNHTLKVEINNEDPAEEVHLHSLNVTPLEYASCENSERFMIDFPTYLQLHPPEGQNSKILREPGEEIPPERMEIDEPPSSPEIFLFPSTVVGYNLRRKKWVSLEVDRIREVEWNKAAFDSLVINRNAKELVQALVTNRLVAEKGTDPIEDKGNGLTILLHGGPGTGKTFTAESVAEFAEKPLYRVTCGDIGTLPEDVEQYLDSALHLGKIWDCVVLLDEADVFLEQRSLSDLQRNALVSVFLRLLEYYDGILILTSNRVGTFDEAFKSRIQLSLNYPPLTLPQRKKIWLNLINRLRKLQQPNIDFEDVECYVSELAEKDMNGRQIRNAITTARQLAKFKGRDMSYEDLKHVIGVASEFDEYLFEVKEKLTDDVIARESGIR